MTLNQLTYFYEAATLQHFNQAAEKLNISEPSLSRSISSLEDEFGMTFFEKKGRNVTLTKAGQTFLEHVTIILNEVKRAEAKMHHLASDGGHIDIAYVSPLARSYIPHTIRSFLSQQENKNVTFNFHQDITSRNIAGLKDGTYDLIFGSYSDNEPGIEFVPIIRQEMVVIMPNDHPLTKKDTIESGVFEQYPVLGYDRTSGLGKYTQSFFQEHDLCVNYICESPDENGIASLVAENFGIALVADVQSVHRDDICIRSLTPAESIHHTVYMGYMRGKYQLPAVSRLIQYVRTTRY